jgi:hypothetical protein
MKRIVRDPPVPPSAHYKFLPPRMEAIVLRAIEKDPARRFQTAEEFLRAIKAFVAEERAREKRLTPPSGIRAYVPVEEETAPGSEPAPPGAGAGVAAPWPDERRPVASAVAGATVILLGLAAGNILYVLGHATASVATIASGTAIGGGLLVAWLLGSASAATGVRAWTPAPRLVGAPAPPPPVRPRAAPRPPSVRPPLPPAVPPAGLARPESPPPVPVAGSAPAAPAAPVIPAPGIPGAVAAGLTTRAPTGWVSVLDGPDRGAGVALHAGTLTIGRGAHNTLALTDPTVSTTHAQITYQGSSFVVQDLHSRNGTFVNGEPVAAHAIHSRDVVKVGETRLLVDLPDPGT